ncbi:androgen-dependent TFPI-regulating protein-like isoform X2 [Leptinotarsa decemlineata]|uniref:androgen-dependent TFPI-regulating protein-like isoform X2 n=1 Tax=Leptinotarsa decemlineata TaxID=7539 RepID=UPI003D30AE65
MERIEYFFENRRTRIPKRVGPFFHLFVCVHHGYVALCLNKKRDLTNITDQRVLDMEVFAPLFFTSWNFLIQLVYFTSALMYDILHMLSIRRDIQEKMLRYKGYIFTSSLFPFSVFVSTMFWSLYNINREFVLPEVLDKYIPTWLNHCLHTNILIFAAIEMLIANQLLPTFISAFFGLNVIVISYHTLCQEMFCFSRIG